VSKGKNIYDMNGDEQFKKLFEKSMVRNIVIKTTERLLPIVFWFGIVVIFIMSLGAASACWGCNFIQIIWTLIITFVPTSLIFITTFYIIYLLKDIRDLLQRSNS